MLELPALYNTILGGLIVAAITGIGGLIWSFLKKRTEIRKWEEGEEVKGVTELGGERFKLVKSSAFIPTMGQYEGPHDSDDITISDNRFLLAEMLLKEILSPDEGEWKKRYAILGGTGMGKSTFSAHLFLKYLNCFKYKKCEHPIYIKYLGKKNVLNDLRKMSENSDVSRSILILDALDENTDATRDTKGFLDKIEEITDKYRIVIITSRTQFFSNKGSEPTKGVVPQNSPKSRFLSWNIIYISPFSEEDTIKYLENRYKIPSREYSKAKKIADMCNDLTMRPLVLSYIDDLLDLADNNTLSIAEVYYTIIDKWLSKECEGYSLSKSDLFKFSKKLAIYIYEKWEQTSDSFITEEDYNNFISLNCYQNNPYSFKGRSLINRRNDGGVKFSHKSFWEFFLAICSLEQPGRAFKSIGFSTAELFAKELYKFQIDGRVLEGINFYRPCFFKNTYDEIEIFRRVQQTSEVIYKMRNGDTSQINNFIRVLWDLWISLTQRLAYQFDNIPFKKEKDDLNRLMSDIQTSFCITNASDYNLLPEINIPMYHSNKIGHHYINDHVVFPFFLSFDDDEKKRILSVNYLYVGFGFNDDNSICNLIRFISNERFGLDVICVYRESENIENHIAFINNLAQFRSKGMPSVLVLINCSSATICYLINDFSVFNRPDDIKKCLTGMLKAYKTQS